MMILTKILNLKNVGERSLLFKIKFLDMYLYASHDKFSLNDSYGLHRTQPTLN